MFKKAETFNDINTATKIMKTSNPVEQKRLGKEVTPFEIKKWIEVTEYVAKEALVAKFTQHENLS